MEKEYSILEGKLYTGLDCYYDEENNQINVYSSVNWAAESEERYKAKENIISDWLIENDLYKAYAWCDISGYNYWMKQREELNYVSIDVQLKKYPNQYTQNELEDISDMIVIADQYFEEKLIGLD